MYTRDTIDCRSKMDRKKGNKGMKAHIEYDDFGEYIEILEDIDQTDFITGNPEENGMIRKTVKKLYALTDTITEIFETFSVTVGNCMVKGSSGTG